MGKQSSEQKKQSDNHLPAPTAEGEEGIREMITQMEAIGKERRMGLGGKPPTPKEKA